jgi:hypothetical protein
MQVLVHKVFVFSPQSSAAACPQATRYQSLSSTAGVLCSEWSVYFIPALLVPKLRDVTSQLVRFFRLRGFLLRVGRAHRSHFCMAGCERWSHVQEYDTCIESRESAQPCHLRLSASYRSTCTSLNEGSSYNHARHVFALA